MRHQEAVSACIACGALVDRYAVYCPECGALAGNNPRVYLQRRRRVGQGGTASPFDRHIEIDVGVDVDKQTRDMVVRHETQHIRAFDWSARLPWPFSIFYYFIVNVLYLDIITTGVYALKSSYQLDWRTRVIYIAKLAFLIEVIIAWVILVMTASWMGIAILGLLCVPILRCHNKMYTRGILR